MEEISNIAIVKKIGSDLPIHVDVSRIVAITDVTKGENHLIIFTSILLYGQYKQNRMTKYIQSGLTFLRISNVYFL